MYTSSRYRIVQLHMTTRHFDLRLLFQVSEHLRMLRTGKMLYPTSRQHRNTELLSGGAAIARRTVQMFAFVNRLAAWSAA